MVKEEDAPTTERAMAMVLPDEAHPLLGDLAEESPWVRRRIQEIMEPLLLEIDQEEVATGVCHQLGWLEGEETQEGGREGYEERYWWAVDRVLEAISDVQDDIERYRRLGMVEEEMETTMGLLAGLHDFHSGSESDVMAEAAELTFFEVLSEWESGSARERGAPSLRGFVSERFPQWEDMLEAI